MLPPWPRAHVENILNSHIEIILKIPVDLSVEKPPICDRNTLQNWTKERRFQGLVRAAFVISLRGKVDAKGIAATKTFHRFSLAPKAIEMPSGTSPKPDSLTYAPR